LLDVFLIDGKLLSSSIDSLLDDFFGLLGCLLSVEMNHNKTTYAKVSQVFTNDGTGRRHEDGRGLAKHHHDNFN